MPQGLQVFDEQGRLIYGGNERPCKILGIYLIREYKGNFYPRLPQGTKFWATISSNISIDGYFKFFSNGMEWDKVPAGVYWNNNTLKVLYGCY